MTESKKVNGIGFFTLWFGAAVSLAEIMTGSLIAPLGMKKGILVILVGHLIGAIILSLVGVIGFREKSPSLICSRKSLGKYGSYIISIFNIIQLIGWTAIMLIQCARSVQSITSKLFGFHNFTVLVVFAGLLVGIWALNNDRGINFINSISVMLLLILSMVMLGVVLSGGEAKDIAGNISFGAALELSIVMPLSWVPLIADYTMSGKSAGSSVIGSFLGYFTGSSLMYIIGLASAVYSGAPDPINVLNNLNMGIIALLIVVLSTVTTTFLDVYSAVMSTLNLSDRLSKRMLIIVFTILGTILAIYFPMEQYENFLYMIGSLFAPVFSVVIADYFIYSSDRSGSMFNIGGIIAAALGVFTYYAVASLDLSLGSTIPSMVVTIAIYVIIRFMSRPFRNKQYSQRQLQL